MDEAALYQVQWWAHLVVADLPPPAAEAHPVNVSSPELIRPGIVHGGTGATVVVNALLG